MHSHTERKKMEKSVKRLNVMSTLPSSLPKFDSNVVLDLLQRNDNFINSMAMICGKIRFYCRTLGILWYNYLA